MVPTETRVVAIYVDRSCPQHWIVRDAAGSFWSVPPVENPWAHRQAYQPNAAADLEPVPGHYKYALGLPC